MQKIKGNIFKRPEADHLLWAPQAQSVKNTPAM